MKTVALVVGWMLIAFALIGIATEFDDTRENRSHNRGVGIALVIICAGGGAMLVRAARSAPAGAVSRGSEIIRVAQKHNGRVTAAEVAADTTIPFDEAKGELDRLAKAGACELVVGDAGILVYRFPEFESAANKQDSV